MRAIGASLLAATLVSCHHGVPTATPQSNTSSQALPLAATLQSQGSTQAIGRISRECESDDDCDANGLKCVKVNRAGELLMARSHGDPEPLFMLCLARCDNAPCARDQRCIAQQMVKLVPVRT